MVVAALTPSVNTYGNDRRWWEDEEWTSEGAIPSRRETKRRTHRLSERTMFDLDKF
jgi:hypothetical protein